MRSFLLLPFGFYVLATAVGLLLRLGFVVPVPLPSYANALHAHSHTLFFGWGALSIFALVFHRLGAEGRQHRAILVAIAAVSAASFVSFLHGGYSVPSIVLSTLSLGLWGWAVVVTWRALRGNSGLDISYLRTGLVYLALACLGAITRVVLIATAASAHHKSLAVYAFLHAFGWFFVFSVMGLLIGRGRDLGMRLDQRRLRMQLRLAAPIAWLAFPLGVAGGSEGVLGMVARGAGAGLFVPLGLGSLALWRGAKSAPSGFCGAFRWLSLWLGIVAISSLAGGFGLAELAVRSRHFAILYLHVLLAGFVSFGLVTASFSTLGARLGFASLLHNAGLAIMALGLAAAGLVVLGYWQSSQVAWTGALLAAIGGALLFVAGVGFAVRAWRKYKEPATSIPLPPSSPRLEPERV